MRFQPRQAIAGFIIAGVAGAILLLPAIYLFGLTVGPPRPIPDTSAPPAIIGEAIWARADGGPARALRRIGPISLADFALCMARADGTNDNERLESCREVIPAMRGLEYLSRLHVTDHGMTRNSFLGGHGALATTVWMTRSWTREQFVNTMAARGDFGSGWRGVATASRRYFAREPGALTLSQAALLASRLGDAQPDPWCNPGAAALMRTRVLEKMRDNGVIDDQAFDVASTAPLELAPPPEGRPPCQD